MTPPRTERSLWDALNFLAPPYKVQSEILQGRPVAQASYLLSDAVLVGDPQLARAVLSNEGGAWGPSLPPHLAAILGPQSVGSVGDPLHGQLRRLLLPSFSAEEVNRYLPQIEAAARRYCDAWAAAGEVAHWHEQLKLFTFEVICTVVGGFDFDQQQLEAMSQLFARVSKGLSFPIPLDVPFTPFGQAMDARRQLLGKLRQQMDAAREAQQQGSSGGGGGMLRRLMDAVGDDGEALSQQQLEDNFISLLIAGHDTTASSLSAIMYHLDQAPEVMAGLRQEQAAVRARHGDALAPPALADMPLAEAVVREAWRLHPVVPVVGRCPLRDTALGRYAVPAGQPTWVALNFIMSSDARWVGEVGELAPAAFAPRRFLEASGRAQGAQLVFGAGAHSCIGAALAWAEVKVLLALLARGYDFRVKPGVEWVEAPFPICKLDCTFGAV